MNDTFERILEEYNQKLGKVAKVKGDIYSEIIPDEMSFEYLNKVHYQVFGSNLLHIYAERDVFKANEILISQFANNGFFWAQILKEMQSIEYENLYELMNSYGNHPGKKNADLTKKYCIARYEGEWFRAYIDEVLPGSRLKVFFIDYGTSAVVDYSETCLPTCSESEIWELAPLVIPCIVKDMTLAKYAKLRKLLYPTFQIKAIKLIEETSVFEVELTDENGKNILELL